MTAAMVRAEGVRKRFGRLEVLKGIDLTVERGQVCCLLGPSGSGKSTFLRWWSGGRSGRPSSSRHGVAHLCRGPG
ncbi:ATP-binding cassette domain-containing protein, partial [Streptomyces sp. NPDC005568]|uniref:ATP-binding cassette domain-containing protein n=1 Tax=Streptomyces sp. NPDC005568 TaxID=3156887 RepID=UPI0033A48B5F